MGWLMYFLTCIFEKQYLITGFAEGHLMFLSHSSIQRVTIQDFFSYEICKLYLGSLIMWYCIEKPYQIYPLTYHLRVLKSSTQKRGFDEVLGHRPWEYHYIAQLEIDKILLPLTSMEKRSSNSNYCSVVDQSGKGKPIWLTYWRYDFSCSVWCPLTSILVYSCDGCFNQLLMLDQVERLNLGTADARKKSENGVGQTRRPAWNPRIWPCLVSFSYIVVSTIYIYIHMLISILPGPTMITVVDEYFLDGSKTPSTFNGFNHPSLVVGRSSGHLREWFNFKDIRAAALATHTRMQCALRSVECWSHCAEKKQFLAIDRQGWSHSISRLDIFTRTSNKTQQHLEFLGQQQNIL